MGCLEAFVLAFDQLPGGVYGEADIRNREGILKSTASSHESCCVRHRRPSVPPKIASHRGVERSQHDDRCAARPRPYRCCCRFWSDLILLSALADIASRCCSSVCLLLSDLVVPPSVPPYPRGSSRFLLRANARFSC